MTDKTERDALVAQCREMADKLEGDGTTLTDLFRQAAEALAAPAGAVAEVVDVCGTGVKVPAWIGTGPAPDIPVGTKLYAGIPPAATSRN